MVKAFVVENEQGRSVLPYVEPKDLYNEPLKLHRAFELEVGNVHYTVLEVKQAGKEFVLYVALTNAKIERVFEVLKWDGKRPIDFRIVRREYTLVREGEELEGEQA